MLVRANFVPDRSGTYVLRFDFKDDPGVCSGGSRTGSDLISINVLPGCVIDVAGGSHTCQNTPAVSFAFAPTGGKTVAKINFDPSLHSFKKAVFEIEYAGARSGWMINIGDSLSNNGWGGDGGHTSNAAEVQIMNDSWTVYSNILPGYGDAAIDGHLMLYSQANTIASAGNKFTIEISDERVGWNNHAGIQGELNSKYLFTLNGQATTYGPVNYDIYAAFNRTVYAASRSGSGIRKIKLYLTQ